MTTSVGFVLSYDFLKYYFIAFKKDIFPMKINIVVTDIVNDVTYSHKSVNTCAHNTFIT